MNNGHVGHDHTHGMAGEALRFAFFLTAVILAVELTSGLLANSLALLSDAGHTITDLVALGLAWFAAVQAKRPSDEHKTFGYHRVGILIAMANAASLIAIAVVISWEAVQRFQHPEPVQPLLMFVSASISITVNLFIAFGLRKEGGNVNVRAVSLHVLGDMGASAGVGVAGLVILLTGWSGADPILSVGIAVLIAIGAWPILRETTDILLESTPKGISLTNLVKDIRSVAGVQNIHDLHVWSITSEVSALSCHILIDNLPPSASSPILRSLTTLLNEKYRISHTTIQFECHAHKETNCEIDGLYCQLETVNERDSCHAH